MYVKSVKVNNFRNYENETAFFVPGVNVIVGDNAQGKTNLIEAVYFAGVGKSFRTARDRELIRAGEDRARVRVQTEKAAGSDVIDFRLDRNEVKRIAINDIPVTRMGSLMGVCSVVLFSPDELKIVKETPAERRRFINISLCQISRAYFYLLLNYGKALASRNKLLKSGNFGEADLIVWDGILAEYGAKIVKNRKGFLGKLAPEAAKAHAFLTDGAENLEVSYEGTDGETESEIKDNMLAELLSCRELDARLKFTHAGAHRDDLKISVNGTDVRSYGSQGQQRTAALSLKLAETEIMTELTGESPVLLLDDVLSELDDSRQEKLLQCAAARQTIITATGYSAKCDKILRVSNGHIQQ